MNDCTPEPTSRSYEKALAKMSPFEIRGTLINRAEKDARCSASTFLNAGRGNPNWLLTRPRKAFFLLGLFAAAEAERKMYDTELGIAASPSSEGVAKRFLDFTEAHKEDEGAEVLRHYFDYMVSTHKVAPDDFVFEMVDGILGDHYPTPPRVLKYTEIMTRDYIRWAMGGGDDPTVYDLFPTEGSKIGRAHV